MSQCSRCKADFNCAMVDGLAGDAGDVHATGLICWCMHLPTLAGADLNGTCLCPACLKALLKQQAE